MVRASRVGLSIVSQQKREPGRLWSGWLIQPPGSSWDRANGLETRYARVPGGAGRLRRGGRSEPVARSAISLGASAERLADERCRCCPLEGSRMTRTQARTTSLLGFTPQLLLVSFALFWFAYTVAD